MNQIFYFGAQRTKVHILCMMMFCLFDVWRSSIWCIVFFQCDVWCSFYLMCDTLSIILSIWCVMMFFLFDNSVWWCSLYMYVLYRALHKWWGQYLESISEMDGALQYYETAQDILSLVRLHCYNDRMEKVI